MIVAIAIQAFSLMGYRCTGSYRAVEEALEKIKYDVPDVVLSDIGLPGMDGIGGSASSRSATPACYP